MHKVRFLKQTFHNKTMKSTAGIRFLEAQSSPKKYAKELARDNSSNILRRVTAISVREIR